MGGGILVRNLLKKILNNNFFHIGILLFIIFVIMFVVGIVIIKYDVEGETNMPYVLSKISIISSSEGKDKEDKVEGNQWNFSIDQNNDIYLYIDKNPDYKNNNVINDFIKQVSIMDIQVKRENQDGVFKIYRPCTENQSVIFSNIDQDIVEDLTYNVEKDADLKNMQITNQGGILAFRCANCDVANYISNDVEINHNELLSKVNISEEKLKMNVKFNLIMKMCSEKIYKTEISLNLPLEGIIQSGTVSKEFTDMSAYIFKRIKNV